MTFYPPTKLQSNLKLILTETTIESVLVPGVPVSLDCLFKLCKVSRRKLGLPFTSKPVFNRAIENMINKKRIAFLKGNNGGFNVRLNCKELTNGTQ